MPIRTAAFLLAVVALVAFVLQRDGSSGGDKDVGPGQQLAGHVTRVVDGDTAKVRVGSRELTVRYIGMDTPESVKPNTPVQCYAKAASHRNEELVAGHDVRLVVGAEPKDRYGRLLAYVYVGRAHQLVNATLLQEGFARTLTIPPNDALAAQFAELQNQAKRSGRGLWSHC
jgi:micrococcal nuclease